MKEIWRDIAGYEGIYQVSNMGRVKSSKNKYEKFLKPVTCGGYQRVRLCKNGNEKMKYVHRLVACAFIENSRNLNEVDHIDRNKANNRVDNLRWVTHSENIHNRAAYSNTGEKHITRDISRGSSFKVGIQRGKNRIQRRFSNIEDAIKFRDSVTEVI